MSGPAGSPDELDQALALANDALPQPPAAGPCAHCPARGGPAGDPTTTDPGATHRADAPGDRGTAAVVRREDGQGPDGRADEGAVGARGSGPVVEDVAGHPWLAASSPSMEGPRGGAVSGDQGVVGAGARGSGPVVDEVAGPWLSALSPSTEGLRGAAVPPPPADDDLAPGWLLATADGDGDGARAASSDARTPPDMRRDADADDLAPAWLLGSAEGDPDASSGEGRLSGVMRALRRPASGEGGVDRDGPADDGLLPEWLTRAARRVGRNRPDTPDAADGTDPDDALAAPWVPRLPTRPSGARPAAPARRPEGRAPGDRAAGPRADDPEGSATPIVDGVRPSGAPGPGLAQPPGAGFGPSSAVAAPSPEDVAVGLGPAGAAPPVPGPGGAAPGDSGRGGAGEDSIPSDTGAGPAGERPSSAPGHLGHLGHPGHPGDTGPGPARGAGEQPLPSAARPVHDPPGEPACLHRCGADIRAGRRTTGAGRPGVTGPAASGPAPASGGPARGGPPGERHDGPVTSHRAAADARSGTPADVPEPTPPDRPAPPPPRTHVTWDEAQRIAARAAAPATAVTVPLDRAARQVLAAPVEALADLPSFDTAAMDGWAVAGPGPWVPADPPGGTGVLAGHAAPAPLPDGYAVRIATGARMPDGATAVLRSERAELRDGRLRLAADAPAHSDGHGTDVRPRGQECRAGDRLLPAGTPVTPPVLGLAAAAGYDRLTVTPRPRAEVLVLGDELLHGGLPTGGRIRDALGPMVGPWLAALGAEVLVTRRLGDDAEALHEAVTTTTADLLVTTGGTAHGPVDHVRPTLHRIGAQLLVDGVEVRPGHPMLLAALAGEQQGRHLVGLPGNPLAAVSGLLTLAAPLLRARAGLPEPEPVRATLTAEVQGHPRDTRLVPVTRSADGSGATPLRWTGPAMLRGIAGASALAAVPPGGAAAGTSVRLLELPW